MRASNFLEHLHGTGSHHPKVGVILTCIALMFRHKARKEHSSSILIQEGLYRRAIDLMKVSPEGSGGQSKVDRCEIAAIAGEAYAEILDVQKNRKPEARMVRGWVRDAWRNRRISMEEVLDIGQPPSKVPVIDTRICRLI
ncbi:hypothetical protein IC575_010264 [Cucumis melo]